MKKFNHLRRSPGLSFNIQHESRNGKRFYATPAGELYPSITSILGEFSKKSILEWRKRVGETEANKVSGKASRRGTRLHSVCESYIQNDHEFLTEELPHIVELFKTIEPYLERIDNVHGVELGLYSDHFGIAGRTDLIAEFDGKLSVIDYKTSNRTKKKECNAWNPVKSKCANTRMRWSSSKKRNVSSRLKKDLSSTSRTRRLSNGRIGTAT
jgi:hypothetical protein